MEMADVGPGVAGGSNRQALSDEDREGRNLFIAWAEAAGWQPLCASARHRP
jgi:N-carbamoyl-L-amino-acid hydrolase